MTWQIVIAVLYLVLGAVLLWLGTVILRENPRNRVNRVTALMLYFAGLGPIFAAVGATIEHQGVPSAFAPAPFPYNLFYIWELFFPQLLLFALVFPVEHPWMARFRRLKYLLFLPHVFHVFWLAFLARSGQVRLAIDTQVGVLDTLLTPINYGLRMMSFLLNFLLDVHVKFFSLVNLVYIIAAVLALQWGYRAVTNHRIRDQVRIIIWGIRLAVGLYALAFIGPALGIITLPERLRVALTIVALLCGSSAIAWSIIRHQFLDIRLIARQSVVFTVSSALFVGAYVLLITHVARFVRGMLELETPLVEVAFVVLVLIFFQPMKTRVDEFITRLMLRSQSDPQTILESFSRQIASVFSIDDLKQRMLTVVTEQLFIERAFFAMRTEGGDRYTLGLAGLEAEAFPAGDPFFAEATARGRPAAFEVFVLDRALTPVTEILGRWGCRLVVPIIDRDHLLAVVLLSDKIPGYRYRADDVNLLATLANQLSVALTNARLYRDALENQKLEDEMQLARRIQMRLLPASPPASAHFDVAAFTQPSRQVGGDYYDFFLYPDGRLGVVIADVSGKGLGAALLVSQLQAILRAEMRSRRTVRECVANANVLIGEATAPEQFATLVLAEFDPSTGVLTYANAGHNYPIAIRSDGGHEHLSCGGLVLGVLPNAEYEVGTVTLEPGDTVLFYTDGLCDLQNPHGENFGEQRILDLLREHRHRPAEDLTQEIVRQAHVFSAGELGFDDLTIVVLKAAGLGRMPWTA